MKIQKWLFTSLFVLLASCAQIEHRDLQTESNWLANNWQAETQAGGVQFWQESFHAPELGSLIAEGLEGNPLLAMQKARAEQARYLAVVQGARRLPELDLGISNARSERNDSLSQSAQMDIGLAWELDLWGSLSHASRAALLRSQVSQLELDAARLSLKANIIRQWLLAISGQQQYRLSEQRFQNLADQLTSLESSYKLGLGKALDLHLARNNVANEKARLAANRQNYLQQLRQLEILLGRYPSADIDLPADFPELNRQVAAGLPAELLLRRPDVHAAWQDYLAAISEASADRARRFPSLRLTGSYGNSSDEISQLLDAGERFWSLFGSLTAPLFNAGRLKAAELEARAAADVRLQGWRMTLLDALAEVENALSAEDDLKTELVAREKAVAEASLAEQVAQEQYRSGLAGYLAVLEAQRRAFDARNTLITTRYRLLRNRVDLHLALGGEFHQTHSAAQ